MNETYYTGLSRLFEKLSRKIKEKEQWHYDFEIKKFGISSEDLYWETPDSNSDLIDTIAVVIAQLEEEENESGFNQYNIERVIREKPKVKRLVTPLERQFVYPFPESEAPKPGTGYYVPFTGYHCWVGQTDDLFWLHQGMVHLDSDSKEQHEKALRAYYEDWKKSTL